MTTHPSSQASDPLNHARRLIGGLAQLRWMLLPPLMVSLAAHAQAQDYTYTTTDGEVALTRYVGSNAMATIPGTIDGLPVTRIKSSAFQSLTNLESVTIPSSVTTIEATAFSGCTSLRSVMIPSSVTTMELYVFSGCTRLTSIDVEPNNPKYRSLDGVLFNKNLTTLMQYPGGKAGTYTLPSGVTTIDDQAFRDCVGLTAITVDPSHPRYSSLDGVLFNKTLTTVMQYPGAEPEPGFCLEVWSASIRMPSPVAPA